MTSGYRSVAAKSPPPPDASAERPLLLVQLQLGSALSAAEQERLRLGLRTRAGLSDVQDVRLEVSVAAPAKPVAVAKKKR